MKTTPTNVKLLVASALIFVPSLIALIFISLVVSRTAGDLVSATNVVVSSSSVPCGLATPNIIRLMTDVGARDPAGFFSSDSENGIIAAANDALCSTSNAHDAMGSLFLDRHAPSNGGEWSDVAVENALCTMSSVSGYKMGSLEGERYIDPLLRITKAYMQANSAFSQFTRCGELVEAVFGEPACEHGNSLVSDLMDASAWLVDGGEPQELPSLATMTRRLLAIALIAHEDRSNDNLCFGNAQSLPAHQLCELVHASVEGAPSPPPLLNWCPGGYTTTYQNATDVNQNWFELDQRVVGSTHECGAASAPGSAFSSCGDVENCGAFAIDGYFDAALDQCHLLRPRVAADGQSSFPNLQNDLVTVCVKNDIPHIPIDDKGDDFVASHASSRTCVETPERTPPPPPPPMASAHWDSLTSNTNNTVLQHCIRSVSLGAFDIEKLFGMSDYTSRVSDQPLSSDFLSWAGRLGYDAAYQSWYWDKRTGKALDAPEKETLMLMLFRVSATLMWAAGGASCCAYWVARGAGPLVAIGLPRLVRKVQGMLKPGVELVTVGGDEITRPPFKIPQFMIIFVTLLVFLYTTTVDPQLTSPYARPICDGSSYETSDSLRNDAIVATWFLGFVTAFTLVYQIVFRKIKIKPVPTTAGSLLRAAGTTVVLQICADCLVFMKDTDEVRKQLTTHESDTSLVNAAKQLDLDVGILLACSAYMSFAFGLLATRWAFVQVVRGYKYIWLACILLPCGLSLLVRYTETNDLIDDAGEIGGWQWRVVSWWLAVASSGTVGVAAALLFQDSAFKTQREEVAKVTTAATAERTGLLTPSFARLVMPPRASN